MDLKSYQGSFKRFLRPTKKRIRVLSMSSSVHVCSETDIATPPCLRRIELGTISWVDSGQIVSSGLHGGVSNVDKMDTIRARANSVLWSGDIIIVKRTSPPQRPDLLLHHVVLAERPALCGKLARFLGSSTMNTLFQRQGLDGSKGCRPSEYLMYRVAKSIEQRGDDIETGSDSGL